MNRHDVTARRARGWTFALAACAVVAFSAVPARGDPNALWNIVHGRCVPNEQQHANPAPCRFVSLTQGEHNGYAVLKDLVGVAQYLLIPTARVGGIESPVVLAPGAPNYFAYAWRARTYVDSALHRALPRDAISLAINSVSGRSQNQLHIHVDCVRADVHATLRRQETSIGTRWAPFGAPLAGHRYLAMRVESGDLDVNPFVLLADGVPGARQSMGNHTLVVVGAVFADGRPGFVILDNRADPAAGDEGSGEELQDHTCAIAR